MAGQARLWSSILYVENMIDDWEEKIDDLLEFEYAYIIHDKDLISDPESIVKNEHGDALVQVNDEGTVFEIRKIHVHLLLNWTNTTTQKAVLNWINSKLSKPGKKCCSTTQPVGNPIKAWKYLIHDTKQAKKEGKFQYSPELRHTGNGFDIGRLVQVSLFEKQEKAEELSNLIIKEKITNYGKFYMRVMEMDDQLAKQTLFGYSGHFDKLIKGVYQMVYKAQEQQLARKRAEAFKKSLEITDHVEKMKWQEMLDAGLDPETGEMMTLNPFDLTDLVEKEREKERLWKAEREGSEPVSEKGKDAKNHVSD